MTMSPLAPAQLSRPPSVSEARERPSGDGEAFKELLVVRKDAGARQEAGAAKTTGSDSGAETDGEAEVSGEKTGNARAERDGKAGPRIFVLPEKLGKPAQEAGNAADKAQEDADTDGNGEGTGATRDGTAVALPAYAAEPAQKHAGAGKENAGDKSRGDAPIPRGAAAEAPGIRDGVAADRAIANVRDGTLPRRQTGAENATVVADEEGSEAPLADGAEAEIRRAARIRADAKDAGDAKTVANASGISDKQQANIAKTPVNTESPGEASKPLERASRQSALHVDKADRGEEKVAQRSADKPAAGSDSAAKTPAPQPAQSDPVAPRSSAVANIAGSIVDAVKTNTNWSSFLKAPTTQFRETPNAQGQTLQAIKVQLHPAELGTLTLHLRAVGNRITVDIKTQEHAAHKLVADGLDSVAKSFQTLGYQVDHVNLASSSGDRSSSLGQWSGDGRERGGADGRRQDGEYANQTARDDRNAPQGNRERRPSGRDPGGRTLYI